MTINVNGVDQPETEIEKIDVAKTVVTVEPCVPLEIIVKFKLKNTQGRTNFIITLQSYDLSIGSTKY